KLNYYDNPIARKKNEAMTYKDLYSVWLEQYQLDVAESTLAKTKSNIRIHILPRLGSMRINKINANHLQKAINKLHYQLEKYRIIYNYAFKILYYAFQRRYIKENP